MAEPLIDNGEVSEPGCARPAGPRSRGRADPPRTIDRLFPGVYPQLTALAERRLAREGTVNEGDAAALVHEVYLALAGQTRARYRDRRHFAAVAATAMRRLLIDRARCRRRVRRGGSVRFVELARAARIEDSSIAAANERTAMAACVGEAVLRLARSDARLARLAELHFGDGLSFDQAAAMLGISRATAVRDCRAARRRLARIVAAALYGEAEVQRI